MAGIDDGRGAWEKVVGGRGAGTPTTPRPQPTRKGIHYLPQALRPLGAGRAREHRELGAKRRRATRAGPVETPAPVRTGAGLPTGWRCWKRMARSSAPGAPLVVLVRRLAGRVEGGTVEHPRLHRLGEPGAALAPPALPRPAPGPAPAGAGRAREPRELGAQRRRAPRDPDGAPRDLSAAFARRGT